MFADETTQFGLWIQMHASMAAAEGITWTLIITRPQSSPSSSSTSSSSSSSFSSSASSSRPRPPRVHAQLPYANQSPALVRIRIGSIASSRVDAVLSVLDAQRPFPILPPTSPSSSSSSLPSPPTSPVRNKAMKPSTQRTWVMTALRALTGLRVVDPAIVGDIGAERFDRDVINHAERGRAIRSQSASSSRRVDEDDVYTVDFRAPAPPPRRRTIALPDISPRSSTGEFRMKYRVAIAQGFRPSLAQNSLCGRIPVAWA